MQDTDDLDDVVFPETNNQFTTDPQFEDSFAQIKIPAAFLRETAASKGKYEGICSTGYD